MMHTIGFQGVHGAYSELAAKKYFGPNIECRPYRSFEEVFRAVRSKHLDFGVIPIENSLAGSIYENYDHLLAHRVWICGEVKIPVRHHLIGIKGSSLRGIRHIYSHPQALAQCRQTLSQMKNVELVPFYDTAGSVQMIVEKGDPSLAAIAGDHAAQWYQAKKLRSGIEDNHENYTRFCVIARAKAQTTDITHYKTSIVYSLKNIPGALFKSLSVFATRDVDLYKIESRPIPGSPWKYIFYLDFAEDSESTTGKNCLRHLREIATFCRVLGTYNRWDN